MTRFASRIIAGALAASLLGASPMPQPTAGSADPAYVALAKQYYDAALRMSPIAATEVSIHDYDTDIGDFSAAGFAKQISTDHAYLDKLAGIDHSALSPSVALDYTLLENSLRDDLLTNEKLQDWRHNPEDYTQSASGAVYSVMSKDYAPLATRMRYAIARERLIPGALKAGEANITSIDPVTQRISAADAAGSVDFFKSSVPLAFTSVHDPALQRELKQTNATAMKAMTAWAAWIKARKPSGTYAIGADAYRQKLLYEDALDMPLDQYLAVGQRALDQTRAQFIATAKRVNPKLTPLQAYQYITKFHPAPNDLLPTARRDLVKLRAFVETKHLITLPPNANIKVVETPPFARTTTSASEDSPGPLETVATQAYYNVTPVDPAWSKKEQEDFLAAFNN